MSSTSIGSEIRLHKYPGEFHVFVGATFTPEAHDPFRKVSHAITTLAA